MKRCFFVGHRETTTDIFPSLLYAIEQLICEYGVSEFYVGNYGGFDRIAAHAVKQLKVKYPQIKLFLVTPYHPAYRHVELPEGFDEIFYPIWMEKTPKRVAIVKANHLMVDYIDYLVAYVWHPGSNSSKLLEYAQKKEIRGELTVHLLSP